MWKNGGHHSNRPVGTVDSGSHFRDMLYAQLRVSQYEGALKDPVGYCMILQWVRPPRLRSGEFGIFGFLHMGGGTNSGPSLAPLNFGGFFLQLGRMVRSCIEVMREFSINILQGRSWDSQ